MRPLRPMPTWAPGTWVRCMTSSTAARTFADRAAGRESIPVATCWALADAAAQAERTRTRAAERAARRNEQDIERLRLGIAPNVRPSHRGREGVMRLLAHSGAPLRGGRRLGPSSLLLPPEFPMRLVSRSVVAVVMLATAATSGAQVPKNVDAAMSGFDAYMTKVLKDWDAPGL